MGHIYTYNERRTFIVGRVCSCCGCPVLSRTSVQFAGRAYFSNNSQRWKYIREERKMFVNKAIAETVREIEVCRRDHVAIRSTPYRSEMIADYITGETFIKGINEPCPNCGGTEPWMPAQRPSKLLEELSDENFPTIFPNDAYAREWALEQVAEKVRQVQLLRQSPQTVAAAQSRVQALKAEMEALEIRRSELKPLNEKYAYVRELETLEENKYDIGILDLKGQLAHREAVNRAKYYIRELEEDVLEAFKPINAQLARLRIALQEALMTAYGCTDGVLVCRVGNSRSFHPGVEKDLALAFHSARYDDAAEEKTGTERWDGRGEPREWGWKGRLPKESVYMSPYAANVAIVMFSTMLILCYIVEIVPHLFTNGDWQIFLWGFFSILAMGTVAFLYYAGTKENRKKYAGMFFLILVSCMLLVVSITGMVFAAQSGAQPRLVLFSVITAVILTAAVLIGLRLRGVKLSKLRLFTKKK